MDAEIPARSASNRFAAALLAAAECATCSAVHRVSGTTVSTGVPVNSAAAAGRTVADELAIDVGIATEKASDAAATVGNAKIGSSIARRLNMLRSTHTRKTGRNQPSLSSET